MEFLSEQRQEALILSFVGDLDALTADQAHGFVNRKLDGGHQQVVIDLSQVEFMSSAGIRVLLDMLRRSRGMGGDLRLASAQPGVERTLELSGMVSVLKLFPTVDEAVRTLGA